MSQHDTENWAHFNVRCEREVREKAEALAKERGWSVAEWVRRAMIEKIERAEDGISETELTEVVRKVLEQMQSERE